MSCFSRCPLRPDSQSICWYEVRSIALTIGKKHRSLCVGDHPALEDKNMAKQTDKKNETANAVLCVKMFGAFTISQGAREAMEHVLFEQDEASATSAEITASLTGRAHRLWLLIAYLIVNRDRGVSPQELIDLLWPEVTSNNPASTLQNNVSRARAIFSEAHFAHARDLIKYTDGLYYWAPDEETMIDTELFEAQALRVGDFIPEDDPAELDRALETCHLYQGDFLSAASDVSWCANRAVYYRTLYKRLCKTTIVALLEAGRLKEAETLCLQVLKFEPAAEEFSGLLMRAYIMDNDPTAALDHYQSISAYLTETYDIRPGTEMETQREIALQELYGRSMTKESIRNFLFESNEDDGAFACSNAVFREITLLRLREMERSGEESHLIAITIDNQMLKSDRRIINAKRVAQVLSSTLRSSDPFTKVGSNQFLVLLPSANAENAQMVFERIVARFKDVFPQADIAFKVSMVSLGALR